MSEITKDQMLTFLEFTKTAWAWDAEQSKAYLAIKALIKSSSVSREKADIPCGKEVEEAIDTLKWLKAALAQANSGQGPQYEAASPTIKQPLTVAPPVSVTREELRRVIHKADLDVVATRTEVEAWLLELGIEVEGEGK